MKTQRLTCLIAMTAALALASVTAPATADLAPPPAPEGTSEAPPAGAPEAPPATPDAGAEAGPAAAPEAAPAEETAPAAPSTTDTQTPADEKQKGGIGAAFWIAILAVFVALGAAYVGTRGKKAA